MASVISKRIQKIEYLLSSFFDFLGMEGRCFIGTSTSLSQALAVLVLNGYLASKQDENS